ncbi:hypothetical protein TNCV_361041 [Trichonephila clavipes]|nr:hypothetical protein TNCV_361041 [Trichonephila clavipes]
MANALDVRRLPANVENIKKVSAGVQFDKLFKLSTLSRRVCHISTRHESPYRVVDRSLQFFTEKGNLAEQIGNEFYLCIARLLET